MLFAVFWVIVLLPEADKPKFVTVAPTVCPVTVGPKEPDVAPVAATEIVSKF